MLALCQDILIMHLGVSLRDVERKEKCKRRDKQSSTGNCIRVLLKDATDAKDALFISPDKYSCKDQLKHMSQTVRTGVNITTVSNNNM